MHPVIPKLNRERTFLGLFSKFADAVDQKHCNRPKFMNFILRCAFYILVVELQLERQCLLDQRQQLELRHRVLSQTAESLSGQLQVKFNHLVLCGQNQLGTLERKNF